MELCAELSIYIDQLMNLIRQTRCYVRDSFFVCIRVNSGLCRPLIVYEIYVIREVLRYDKSYLRL